METYLHPDPINFAVGDRPEVFASDFTNSYITLREPESPRERRILELWTCPNCFDLNWALVTFHDSLVAQIETVNLTADILGQAHFLTESIDDVLVPRIGASAFASDGTVRPDLEQFLAAHLEKEQ